MKRLLLILLMIPVICSARTNAEIKRLVKDEFRAFMNQDSVRYSDKYEACKVKLVRLTEGVFQINTRHLKGTLYIAEDGECKYQRIPIALDIYDGEDLVVHAKGQALKFK
jgi:hypothetical protein